MLKSHFDLSVKEDIEEVEALAEATKRERKEPKYGVEAMEETMGEVEDYNAPEEQWAVYPERRLKRSEVSINLSLLGKTAEGDGFTYIKAQINGLMLTEISAIKSFKHLQFLDLSKNCLKLKALQVITELPFLVFIKANQNVLKSAALRRMRYLQVIIMNKNFIRSIEDVFQPELSTLELGENMITKPSTRSRMETLRCLDLRNNSITELKGMNYPQLDSLYLAGNRIKLLDGIERLVNLRILHLRHNPIRLLTAFTEDLKKLRYLNLRNCRVSSVIQVKKLRVLPTLTTLILKSCPYMGGSGQGAGADAEEDNVEARIMTLAALPNLTRFNKNRVTPEEQAEAHDLMALWMEEGENDVEEVPVEQQETEEMTDG